MPTFGAPKVYYNIVYSVRRLEGSERFLVSRRYTKMFGVFKAQREKCGVLEEKRSFFVLPRFNANSYGAKSGRNMELYAL